MTGQVAGTAGHALPGRLSRLMAVTDRPLKLEAMGNARPRATRSETGRRLAAARESFAEGFERLLASPEGTLPRLFQDLSGRKRGFALEGGAMGATLLDEFGRGAEGKRLGRLLVGRSSAERFLIALGAGMAAARMGKPFTWMPAGLCSAERGAVADGYGFHQAFFSAQRFLGRGFPARPGKWGARYDLGLGRGLFFAAGGDGETVTAAVAGMPRKRRKSLWRGIGTASAFAGGARCAEECEDIIAGRFKPDLQAGIEDAAQIAAILARSTRRRR